MFVCCFSETDSWSRRKREPLFGAGEIIFCERCKEDSNFKYVYEEQHHKFGYDNEEKIANPIDCGDVQCEVTITDTALRSDQYTKGTKVTWNTGLTSKISNAISVSLGHTGEVSWAWSNTRTESKMTTRKCPGLPGQRVTIMFKPKYQLSEGILHKRASANCKDRCGTSDKPDEEYKIKSYGKRNGYLVGLEKCKTVGGAQQSGNGRSGNRGSNCRGSDLMGPRYDSWCETNCALNNCSSVYCKCS